MFKLKSFIYSALLTAVVVVGVQLCVGQAHADVFQLKKSFTSAITGQGGSATILVAPPHMCKDASTCPSGKPFCLGSTSGNTGRSDNSYCVECLGHGACAKASAAGPYCVSNSCSSSCNTDATCNSVHGSAKPLCASGKCVQCTSNANCSGATPFCNNNFCSDLCANSTQCANVYPKAGDNKPYCTTGSGNSSIASGKCVRCLTSKDCTVNSNQPYCQNNTCVSTCTASSQCSLVHGTAKGICNSGTCVQCTSGSNCPAATPYCNSNTCSASCSTDSQCSGGCSGYGVCNASKTCIVAECTMASQCGDIAGYTKACTNYKCTYSAIDNWCSSASSCPAKSGYKATCVSYGNGMSGGTCSYSEYCTSTSHCPSLYGYHTTCVSGKCGTTPWECTSAADCTSKTNYTKSCNSSSHSCEWTYVPPASNSSSGSSSSSGNGSSSSGSSSNGSSSSGNSSYSYGGGGT